MPTLRVKKDQIKDTFFVTIVVTNHLPILKSNKIKSLLIQTLNFYRQKLKLKLFGYVIMSNHIHLLVECNNMIEFIRGFKSYTSKRIKSLIENKDQIYFFFDDNKHFHLWTNNNWPIMIDTEKSFLTKLNYIHENPTRAGLVNREEDWKYSSARNYYFGDHSVIQVDCY